MKINEILECFNKALDEFRASNGSSVKTHFAARSAWERKIGAVKRAYTEIDLIDNGPYDKGKATPIITQEYVSNVPSGAEVALIETTERRALKEFIIYWSEHLNDIIYDTIE